MEEPIVIEILKNELGFSDSSIKKLKKFHNYLLEYNKRYNLISKNTERSIWIRHILDSAQIIKLIDESKDHNIVDFGSGAGFPGLIIAFYNENVRFLLILHRIKILSENVNRASNIPIVNVKLCMVNALVSSVIL